MEKRKGLKLKISNCFVRLGIIFSRSLLLVVFVLMPVYGTTYYVDATNGSDSNNGTSQATAWKSITKVNASVFNPGDYILFKSGETWQEQLNVPSSGSSGNPITMGSYGSGNKPIINGAILVTNWNNESGNVWKATCTSEPRIVYFDDERGTGKSSTANLNAIKEWYWASGFLYAYATSDLDTAYTSPGIEAGKLDHCIYAFCKNYIVIDGLTITKSNYTGISNFQGDDWTVKDCTIYGCANRGIYLQGNDAGLGSITGQVVENNTINEFGAEDYNSSGTAGILLRGTDGAIVRNNYVAPKHVRGIQLDMGDSGGAGADSKNSEVYENEVAGFYGAGISLAFTDNSKAHHNYVHGGSGIGIATGGDNTGTELYYNVIYNLSKATNPDPCYNGFDLNNNSDNGKVYNNTVYKVHYACLTLEEDESTPCDGWEIKNNILDASANTVEGGISCAVYVSDGNTNNTWGFNLYRAGNQLFDTDGSGTIDTYSAWQTYLSGKTGCSDNNSIDDDPLFTSYASGDFTLQWNSPCIDAGTDVGLTQDFDGNAIIGVPDIGAYEYQSNTYYVDASNGNDSNPGTKAEPWLTIQHAADTIVAGDSCIVLPGYYNERVQIMKSGSSGAPITYNAQDSVISKGFTVDADYIHITGFEITDTADNYWDGPGIACTGNVNFCQFEDNDIHNTVRVGILLESGSSHCIVRNNHIQFVWLCGVDICGENHLIEGNDISHTLSYPPGYANPPDWTDADGIHVNEAEHIILRKNYVHDILRNEGGNDIGPDPAHIDGFQTIGSISDILWEQNTFHIAGTDDGFQGAMISTDIGPISNLTFRNNIFIGAFNLNMWADGGIIDEVTVVNNVFKASDDVMKDAYAVELHECTNAKVMNNVFYNCGDHVRQYLWHNTEEGLEVGYNCHYMSDGQPPESTDFLPRPTDVWQVDPKFENVTNGDFYPQWDSPLIDAGITLPEVPDDYDGTPRPQGAGYDIGAYEYLTTGVDEQSSGIQLMFRLYQNYPNPFNPVTTINYSIPKNTKVNITIYNVYGRLVRTLINKRQRAGNYIIQWDGKDEKGISIASGVYFYRLQSGKYAEVKRCIFLK